MFEEKITINNKTGLHARPAAELMALSKKYESDIKITTDKAEVDPKSIISILSGGIYAGTEITLQVEGPDEEAAGAAIADLLKNLPD